MFKLVKKKPKQAISLRNHYERRNKILIKRRVGGFGDILMQRMMMEDLSKTFPEAEITFTCPTPYLEMAKNHPFAKTIDISKIKEEEYGIVYDISTACRVHESRYPSTNNAHRSDIWAAYCGISLTQHKMHLSSTKDALLFKFPTNLPTVLLTTQSTNDAFGLGKSLTNEQITQIVTILKNQGYFLYTIHNEPQIIYEQLGVHQFISVHPQTWINLVDLADYVISVDTATFHIAGGLQKPLVGVFTFTNGKVYGKYYDFVLVQKHRDNGDWDCGPCFNLFSCPKSEEIKKPCVTELTADDILQGFYKVVEKYPSKNNPKSKKISLPVHTS
jgi:ADP-heptose:LPS heptosyltransferase